MFKMSYSFLFNSRVCNRSAYSIIFTKLNELSTVPSASALEATQLKSDLNLQNKEQSGTTLSNEKPPEVLKTKSRIIAAAFASLSNKSVQDVEEIITPNTNERIASATTVDELLSLSNGQGVSRKFALKIVSVLADWTTAKKIKLADFENDFRFVRLCRVLTKGNSKNERYISAKSEDLSTILSVTADDEAAKLVETITLPQMVKVMTTLSNKKRRSMLLLRTLSYNICGSPEKLNLKLCADLLYSMCSLNFIDDNLLSRVALDVCTELELKPEIKKSAVIGSILTSLGLLKYKNPVVLDMLTRWVAKNYTTCRNQDIFSLFITLGILNYIPPNVEGFFELASEVLTEEEAGMPVNWLDHIWSKVLLNIATPKEVSHVLSDEFLTSLSKSNPGQNTSTMLKILNINGAANCLLKDYTGNKLSKNSPFINVVIPKRKDKIIMAEAVVSSLKNLIQAEKYLRRNIDTGYGFCIDAECVLDDKFRPNELNVDKPNGTRIAIISLDYFDMTKGRIEPTGLNVFAEKLLEAKGYKVLTVPFTEFNPKDNLLSRVQYLEKSLKELVKNV